MSIFVATPNAVYYERQTLFTVLVWISALGSIAGMIHSMVRLFCYGFDLALMNILCLLFVLVWAIKILGKEDFFFTGDLNKVRLQSHMNNNTNMLLEMFALDLCCWL